MTPTTHRTPLCRNGLRLLIIAAEVLPFPVSAQVNVEALRSDNPPLGYSGTFGGDLSLRTGNVDLVQLGLNARLYRVTESITRLIVGNGDSVLSVGAASHRPVCCTIARPTSTTTSSRRSGGDN